MNDLVVCTRLSGRDPHKQFCMGRMRGLWSLGDVMVRTLTWNTKDEDPSPALGPIFPIVSTHMTIMPFIRVRGLVFEPYSTIV